MSSTKSRAAKAKVKRADKRAFKKARGEKDIATIVGD